MKKNSRNGRDRMLPRWSHYPGLPRQEQYESFLRHMEEKYSDREYFKLWIPESVNAERLAEFGTLLRDEEECRRIFDQKWDFLSHQPDLGI